MKPHSSAVPESFLGSYPLGKGVVLAEVPLPEKVGKEDQSPSQRNLVPPVGRGVGGWRDGGGGGGGGNLLPYLSTAEVQEINIISLITEKDEYACWFPPHLPSSFPG